MEEDSTGRVTNTLNCSQNWICLVSLSLAVPVICQQIASVCVLNCCFYSLCRRPWRMKGWVNPASSRSRHVPPVIAPIRTHLSARPLCSKCPLAQSACACEKGERGPIGAPVSKSMTHLSFFFDPRLLIKHFLPSNRWKNWFKMQTADRKIIFSFISLFLPKIKGKSEIIFSSYFWSILFPTCNAATVYFSKWYW